MVGIKILIKKNPMISLVCSPKSGPGVELDLASTDALGNGGPGPVLKSSGDLDWSSMAET